MLIELNPNFTIILQMWNFIFYSKISFTIENIDFNISWKQCILSESLLKYLIKASKGIFN